MPLSALQMAVRSLQNLIKVDLRASINPLDKLRSSQIFSIKYKFTLSNWANEPLGILDFKLDFLFFEKKLE